MIDKSMDTDMWTTASDLTVNGYKVVFDANGIDTLQQSFNHLSPGGRLVTYGEFQMEHYGFGFLLVRMVELNHMDMKVYWGWGVGVTYKKDLMGSLLTSSRYVKLRFIGKMRSLVTSTHPSTYLEKTWKRTRRFLHVNFSFTTTIFLKPE